MKKQVWTATYAKWLSYIIIAIATAGFGAWMLSLGYQSDDLWYKHYFPGETEYINKEPGNDFGMCVQREITTWSDVWHSIANHNRYWNNSRLANSLMFISLMFPKWVTDVLHTAAMLLMLWGFARIISGRKWARHPARLAAVILFIWVGWPWYDLKGSSDYFFNYVWTTGLLLYFLILFKELRDDSGWRRVAWTAFVGFITAIMHEGITVPFAAGLGGYILLSWKFPGPSGGRASRAQVLSTIAFYVGILLVTVLSPSFLSRLDDDPRLGFWWVYYVIQFGFRLYFVYFGLLLAGWLTWRRGWKWAFGAVARNSLMVISFIGGLAMIIYTQMNFIRGMWALYIASTILLAQGLASAGVLRGRTKLSLALGTLGALLIAGFFVDLVTNQRVRTDEIRRLDAAIIAAPVQSVYYVDIDNDHPDNWWVNQIAMHVPSHEQAPDLQWILHRNNARSRGLGILPVAFRGVPLDSLPLIPGTAGLRGVYPYYFSTEILRPKPTIRNFFTTFRFPEGTSPFVEYSPASLGRLIWHPMGRYDEVSTGYGYYAYRVKVSDELRRLNFVPADVDSFMIYSIIGGRPTLNGMRPVRIDL